MTDNFSINLKFAMGITDIDDKIIAKGKQKGFSSWSEMQDMTRGLEDDFFFDMDRLNVRRPDAVLRVTEHIEEIIAYVSNLVQLGHAYVSEDGVYFSVSSMGGEYDKFGLNRPKPADVTTVVNTNEEEQEELIPEPIVYDASSHCKRDQRDFALWKLATNKSGWSDDAGPSWASPWGPGRPGWHIECSAMTHAYFGPHIDIHSGGVDLKFPHHNNEIAQW